MKKINKESVIYVACPANISTGGPELLHQLCNELRFLGLNAFMFYYNRSPKCSPVPNQYLEYQNPYVDNINDIKGNLIIVPEKKTNLLNNFNSIQKIIWWLSVDNYYKCIKKDTTISYNFKKFFSAFIPNKSGHFVFWKRPLKPIIHFVQSEYARKHLTELNVESKNIFYLSDYINMAYTSNLNASNIFKSDIVLYSPKKGYEFAKRVIEFSSDIEYVPLENLNREQMVDLFKKSKVYIDFGNHPGKDRIPREAALADLCIITNKRGSAYFQSDVSIPEEYKFENYEESITQIINLIKDCLHNYDLHKPNFREYKEKILREHDQFRLNVKNIFIDNFSS
jgi:hypothetical protein